MENKDKFYQVATKLSHNPIGIIGLFLVIVEGIAALVISNSNLEPKQNSIIVLFIVLFPLIVLFTFYKLVTSHHEKLYSPSDYKDEKNFVDTIKKYDYVKGENVLIKKIKHKEIEEHVSKINEESSIENNRELIENNLVINEMKTITNVLNNIVEMQEVLLNRKKEENYDMDNKRVEELKADIDKKLSIDIPKAIKMREYNKYKVIVCEINKAGLLIKSLIRMGVNAEPYIEELNPFERSTIENSQAIWLGSNVPVEVAVKAIKTSIRYFPQLKYIHLSKDGNNGAPIETHDQIFIGGSTKTAKKYGLKPWSKDDFNYLSESMEKSEFHEFIRRFY